jgi:hypothetical protein
MSQLRQTVTVVVYDADGNASDAQYGQMTRRELETLVAEAGGMQVTPDVYRVCRDDSTTAEYWIG